MPTNKPNTYLHGFTEEERLRLKKQAAHSEFTVYQDLNFTGIQNLLEVGCGVGAQSEILLRRFPNLKLTGIDQNQGQIDEALKYLGSFPHLKGRYDLIKMDASEMDFESHQYDAAFLCWILEHVKNPQKVLGELRRVLRPGSQVIITEVMNSSFFLDPYSPHVWQYWLAFNDLQHESGGDPFVGAKLGNLLLSSGYKQVETKVKTWHYDNREPAKRKTVINYWRDLLLSGAEQLLEAKKVDKDLVRDMTKELNRVDKDPNAVFFYSFIQARANT